ncbi:dockerin type I repeat-containing protein, partial [bacterium]|nr:dockerin type I repeat-containing protein [bacterium]
EILMRYLILTLLLSFSFSECDDLNALQCSSNTDCEWVEDIETGNCGNLSGDDCELNPECNWNCDSVDDYMGWCTYSCDGGSYEIDNSYCQENPNPPTCSEMSQTQCNNTSDCQWTEDTEWGNCGDYNSGWSCDNAHEDCFWDLCYGGWYGSWSHCCRGGSFQTDNSYCEESDYIQGDLNGDLTINILDVLLIIDIILNQESSDLADINGDGIVNILDIIELVDLILE